MVRASGLSPVYIATAQAFDDEMKAKIEAHKTQRGAGWRTVEAPIDVASALAGCTADEMVLLDCATLWLTNLLLADQDTTYHFETLITSLVACPCPVVVVSNEVGQGIVPENKLARRFRTQQGQLNQRLAADADIAVLVTAGLPLALKGTVPV